MHLTSQRFYQYTPTSKKSDERKHLPPGITIRFLNVPLIPLPGFFGKLECLTGWDFTAAVNCSASQLNPKLTFQLWRKCPFDSCFFFYSFLPPSCLLTKSVIM
jgi:hypothetical protein